MAGEAWQHVYGRQHEQQMWREKRDGASSLDRREPFDPIAIVCPLSGNDDHVCALVAAFEEAWLKGRGSIAVKGPACVRLPARARRVADKCAMIDRRALSRHAAAA